MKAPSRTRKPSKSRTSRQTQNRAQRRTSRQLFSRAHPRALSKVHAPTQASAWKNASYQRLSDILETARGFPTLRKIRPASAWRADLHWVSGPQMKALNQRFRAKAYATDILSFPTPPGFMHPIVSGGPAVAGTPVGGLVEYLGELVLCLPVLKRQAREAGHSLEEELDVLLTHGVLHLLGFDHELGPREATEMARWERKILGSADLLGLIHRSRKS